MRTFAIPACFVMSMLASVPASAAPTERRLHSDSIDASTFLWNDWNKFVENYHPNYVVDDDPKTAWVEGASGSGAGEWIRIQITPLDTTTRVRLRVRNGYQKSTELWNANARAKAVTVRLLPGKTEKTLTLSDTEGWQDLVIDQAAGPVRAVELAIGSVYEGSKYPDLCISDVQVFATSETADNPAFEKSKRETLMRWRAARLAAAKVLKAKTIELPLYPAYAVTSAKATFQGGIAIAQLLEDAAKDPGFAKEWKDALAIATGVAKSFDSLPRVQLAPARATKLVAVDGIQITDLSDIETGEGPYLEEDAIRLPMLGTVAALFADQLRVLDVRATQTITQFKATKKCKSDVTWALRETSKEATGPAKLRALVVGRCGRVEGREGTWTATTIELLVYGEDGRLVLLAGDAHVEGYRWTTEAGKPMLAGGRSLLALPELVIEATKREAVAAK